MVDKGFGSDRINQMVKSHALHPAKSSADAAETLDRLFSALSDGTRRSILVALASGESTVSEIAKPYKMSLAAVSKHLGVLESAGLIERRRVGSFQVINLRAESLKSANEWMVFYENFWDRKLDVLQDLLERKKNDGKRKAAD